MIQGRKVESSYLEGKQATLAANPEMKRCVRRTRRSMTVVRYFWMAALNSGVPSRPKRFSLS